MSKEGEIHAVVVRKDGSEKFVPVGREDLLTNGEGKVVGVVYADAKPGDELKDVYMTEKGF